MSRRIAVRLAKTIAAPLALAAGLLAVAPGFAQTPATAVPPIPAPRDVAYPGVIRLHADLSDLDRRIFRVRQTLPVAGPGPTVLLYPDWLPGKHAPRGAIDKLAGLVVRANGQAVPWRRDPVQMHAFHVVVPPGARALELEFQFLTPTQPTHGRIVVTPEMLNLQPEMVVLYPAGHASSRIMVEPSITLPAGWRQASALEPASAVGTTIHFKPVNLETFVDSPMFAGRHFRQIDLDPGAAAAGRPPVRLNIVADAPENLKIKPEQLDQHRALVVQADRLFGARPFDRYDFLLALSDRMGGIGLEHHRSSENGVPSYYFTDWPRSIASHDLLPHEYVHSWNGKYRRGADLITPNYNTPMRDSLLWVYEGLTTYWGEVLAARAGLVTRDQAIEQMAMTAATYADRPGRSWRPLSDTTNGPILSARRPQPWTDWQRGEDYYAEGGLVWLDVDTLISERSGGRRSLDDFARAFFGGLNGRAAVSPYRFEDVVAALNAVQPYDWAGFLRARLDAVGAPPFLDGIERGGYRLVFTEAPSDMWKSDEARRKVADLTHSLGLVADDKGELTAVRWEGPAFRAGLATGHQIVAVNGAAYAHDRLRQAVRDARGGAPLQLLIKAGEAYRTVPIAYRDGLRYPRLERVVGAPDRLDQILAPAVD